MIKAICFDLDGVYFTPKGKNSFQENLTSKYGIPSDIVSYILTKSPEMSQLVRGQISPEGFWNRFREIANINATDLELAEEWVKNYEVDENVKSVVKKVKKLGYKTCVCTNNNIIRLPLLREHFKLDEDFDCIVSSHEVGACKPERKIYQALLEKLNIDPDELVYSDDNPDRLHGATELGINTFQYFNFEQFVEELRNLNVEI